MAARTKTTKGTPAYRCTECGWTTAKWVGRCGECQTWGSVEEAAGGTVARTRTASSVQKPAQVIGEVDSTVAAYMSTGNPEFDRVLGGGLVPGAVILMAGAPGGGGADHGMLAVQAHRREAGLVAAIVVDGHAPDHPVDGIAVAPGTRPAAWAPPPQGGY